MALEKALYLIHGRGFNKTVCKMATARTYSESSDEEFPNEIVNALHKLPSI